MGFSPLPDGGPEVVGVVQALTNLSSDLRKLKNLPLCVSSVQGSSPVFSYTEVLSMGRVTVTFDLYV